jgi:hypothetical protein
MYVVIFILIMIGILSLQFHQMSRQAGSTAFRVEKSESLKHLAEAAIDEAFMRVWQKTEEAGSAEFVFLANRSTGTHTIPLPLFEKKGKPLLSGYAVTASAQMRIVDFKDRNRSNNVPFYPGEGVGCLEISTGVTAKRAASTLRCQITRHYDFRILTALTKRSGRTKYAQNCVHDYALLIRKGYDEFTNPRDKTGKATFQASSYNSAHARIILEDQNTVPAEKRGKLFIGGTDVKGMNPSGGGVFLNLAEGGLAVNDLLPKLVPQKPPKTILEIDFDQVCKMIPELKTVGGGKQEVQDELEKVVGVFEAQVVPLVKSGGLSQHETDARKYIIDSLPANDFRRNLNPPVIFPARSANLLADAAYLATVVEGALRQRFLYLVTFYLDGSKSPALQAEPAVLQKLKDAACVSAPLPQSPTDKQRKFVAGVDEIEKGSPTPPFPLTSRFEEFFLYKAGLNYERKASTDKDSFQNPPAFYSTGHVPISVTDPAFKPYASVGLRFRWLDVPSWLEQAGIVTANTGKMRLRGIVRVMQGKVGLKSLNGKPFEFSGKGVIMAEDGFVISSGIKRSPGAAADDFLVLMTGKGNIEIDTTETIEAGLVAISRDGRLIPRKNMNIKGSVAVDKLQLDDWAAGDHSIAYDPVFAPANDVLQVIPSPQVTFQRISEEGN